MANRDQTERSLLDKLGVRAGQRISVLNQRDHTFAGELRERGADVSHGLRRNSDQIFVTVDDVAGLARLRELRGHIKPSGSIWVIRKKGKDAVLKETDVIDAGLAARMVDNKIVSFSETEGAMRLVIRLVDR